MNDLEDLSMLYPPVADLLKNVSSRYLLVNVVAQRARQISEEAEAYQEELTEKPVTLAIREVAEGKTNTFVLSYDDTIAIVKNKIQTGGPNQKFMVWNSTTNEFEDKTSELLNGDYDEVSIYNNVFKSSAICLSML